MEEGDRGYQEEKSGNKKGREQCSWCLLQDFNLLHLSLPKQSPLCLFWLPLLAKLFSV